MGLGAVADVPLAVARDLAAEARRKVAAGIDPITERAAARETKAVARAVATTFEIAAVRRREIPAPIGTTIA